MKERSNIPAEKDWKWDTPHPYYTGDVEYSKEQFGGRSAEEMVPRIIEFPLSASEDLLYMPKIPFQYYVMAFKMVLMSEEYRRQLMEGSDLPNAASTFLLLLQYKFRDSPDHIAPMMPELLPVAEFVAANQILFEADPSNYGSFPELLKDIKARYSAYQSSSG